MAAPRVTTELSGRRTTADPGNFNSSKSWVPHPIQPDVRTTMQPSHYGVLTATDQVRHVVRHEKDADPAVVYRTYTDKAVLERPGQERSGDKTPGLRGVKVL